MRSKILMLVLLSFFIIVANDNGLFDGNKNLSQSQIQRDQQNYSGDQTTASPNQNAAPNFSAYPPLPD
jgi:hypothetical protein